MQLPSTRPLSDVELQDLIESRSERYGPPTNSMDNIGLMITGLLNQHYQKYGITLPHPVPGHITAFIMALVKINRAAYAHSPDNTNDARAFLAFSEDCQARGRVRRSPAQGNEGTPLPSDLSP
jgi:hypothetical protein